MDCCREGYCSREKLIEVDVHLQLAAEDALHELQIAMVATRSEAGCRDDRLHEHLLEAHFLLAWPLAHDQNNLFDMLGHPIAGMHNAPALTDCP